MTTGRRKQPWFALKKKLQHKHTVGKGNFRMSQFWTGFGQHLCGPKDMWETRFQEHLCLKKGLVLSTAPVAHMLVFLRYVLLQWVLFLADVCMDSLLLGVFHEHEACLRALSLFVPVCL